MAQKPNKYIDEEFWNPTHTHTHTRKNWCEQQTSVPNLWFIWAAQLISTVCYTSACCKPYEYGSLCCLLMMMETIPLEANNTNLWTCIVDLVQKRNSLRVPNRWAKKKSIEYRLNVNHNLLTIRLFLSFGCCHRCWGWFFVFNFIWSSIISLKIKNAELYLFIYLTHFFHSLGCAVQRHCFYGCYYYYLCVMPE